MFDVTRLDVPCRIYKKGYVTESNLGVYNPQVLIYIPGVVLIGFNRQQSFKPTEETHETGWYFLLLKCHLKRHVFMRIIKKYRVINIQAYTDDVSLDSRYTHCSTYSMWRAMG